MDSVLEGLGTVKDQLRKMEEREAEKGLQQSLKKAVNELEEDCQAMKEKLFEVKTEIKAKAGEIVTAVKQKGKVALNKWRSFLGLRRNQKIFANTFRTFADEPEKEYGEEKFSKTELIKKPFQAKRKLLFGILNCVDAAIEKTEQLAAEVKQYQADKEERETAGIGNVEAVNPVEFAVVAEPEFQYGAEIFEAHQQETAKVLMDDKTIKSVSVKSGKSRQRKVLLN